MMQRQIRMRVVKNTPPKTQADWLVIHYCICIYSSRQTQALSKPAQLPAELTTSTGLLGNSVEEVRTTKGLGDMVVHSSL
jgi:hypothetical protein